MHLELVDLASFLEVFGPSTDNYTVQLPNTVTTLDRHVGVFA